MNVFLDFFKNLWSFIVSINANAFWTIVYMLSQNWFIILAIGFIAILIYSEIKINTNHIIDDKREMY
jgi:hypothetical protein